MRPDDLAQVLRIQDACYDAGFHEPREAFLTKLLASPTSCWVSGLGGQIYAYLVSLPIDQNNMPALHADRWRPAAQPTLLYLHDMAIAPASRGGGLSRALLNVALAYATAHGLRSLGLVAVQDSQRFWRKQGFEPTEVQPGHAAADKLAAFGEHAVYMTRVNG